MFGIHGCFSRRKPPFPHVHNMEKSFFNKTLSRFESLRLQHYELFNLSHPDTRPLLEKLENNCKPFSICLEECKEVVKEVRKHPCLSGDVGKYIVHRATKMFNGDFPRFLSLLQSCDVEMLKDKQVQRLTNNNESSGSVSPRRHLELIVSFLCVTLILLI